MKIDYTEILKRYNEANKRRYKNKGRVFISNFCATNCELQLSYIFGGQDLDEDLFIWPGMEAKIGCVIHDIIQDRLLGEDIIYESEKLVKLTLDENITINMKVDGVLNDGSFLEIKTIGTKDLNMRKAKKEHIAQLNFYMGVAGVKNGQLDYFKRENGLLVKSFEIEYDEELFAKTLDKIVNVVYNDNIEELKKDTSNCHFCPYKEKCAKDSVGF